MFLRNHFAVYPNVIVKVALRFKQLGFRTLAFNLLVHFHSLSVSAPGFAPSLRLEACRVPFKSL